MKQAACLYNILIRIKISKGYPHESGKLYFLPPNDGKVQFEGWFQHGIKVRGQEFDVNGTKVSEMKKKAFKEFPKEIDNQGDYRLHFDSTLSQSKIVNTPNNPLKLLRRV